MIQSLPQRCAKCAIYILSGVLPFEALYHYSLLSMLGRIIRSENRILACLAVRQLSQCSFTSNSWFVRVSRILTKYDLPDMISLLEDTPTEALWKSQIRKAVYGSWEVQLRDTAAEKSTLAFLNVSTFAVGRTHQVWTTTEPCTQDVKRAAIKVKVLTSTYLLQATRARFRQNKNITPTCPLCGQEEEDRTHFLLVCENLAQARDMYLPQLLKEAHSMYPDASTDRNTLLQLIIDCSILVKDESSTCRELMDTIESISRRLVYALHCRRMELLSVMCVSKRKPPNRQ